MSREERTKHTIFNCHGCQLPKFAAIQQMRGKIRTPLQKQRCMENPIYAAKHQKLTAKDCKAAAEQLFNNTESTFYKMYGKSYSATIATIPSIPLVLKDTPSEIKKKKRKTETKIKEKMESQLEKTALTRKLGIRVSGRKQDKLDKLRTFESRNEGEHNFQIQTYYFLNLGKVSFSL